MPDRALVIYESMFGNTERVALAIRDGLRVHVPAEAVAVNEAPTVVPDDVALVVVGGPTHAFSMSRPSTRADASKQSELVMPAEIGIREWLDALGHAAGAAAGGAAGGAGGAAGGAGRTTRAATFDTRVTKVRHLPGSAARAAERHLRKLGYKILSPAESFYVDDLTGPLHQAEQTRAEQWGQHLAQLLTTIRSVTR